MLTMTSAGYMSVPVRASLIPSAQVLNVCGSGVLCSRRKHGSQRRPGVNLTAVASLHQSRVAASATAAKPEQLWEQLKGDADKAYSDAHDLIERAEQAASAADAAQSSLTTAQQAAADAEAKATSANTEAQRSLEAVSDALAGALSTPQSVTTDALHSLAVSRLNRWQEAHPAAAQIKEVIKTQVATTSMQGTAVAVHFASASLQDKPHAVIGIAIGATDDKADLEGLLLHWGIVAGRDQEWQQPPAGWHTDPDYSQGEARIASAGKAWQTPLGRYAPNTSDANPAGSAFAVVLQLPLEGVLSTGGGIQFVLKRAQGSQPEWLTGPDGKDFYVNVTQALALAQAGQSTEKQPEAEEGQRGAPTSTAGMDKHAKKALWEARKAQRKQGSSGVQNAVPAKVAFRSLEDWVALDSGNSFAWSAQQHGSHREQLDVLRKLIEQQQQGDTEADTALATAKVALEAAEPAVAEAESAQQACISGNPDLDKLARDASHADDEMKSLQAEAEVAVRIARRAACRLKGKQQEISLSDLQHLAETEQQAWYSAQDSRQPVKGIQPQTSSFRIQSIDGSLVSHETICQEADKYYAAITIACGAAFDEGELEQTSLHWAVASGQGQPWEGPPAGWHTDPDSSEDAGAGAYQTLMKRVTAPGYPSRTDIAAHVVTLLVPLEGSLQTGGIVFVLKTGQQQWLAARSEGVLRSDFFISTEQAAIDLEESLAAPVDTPANGSNGNASTETEANGSNGNESNGNESNGNGSNGNGSNGNGSNGNGSHLKHAEAEPTAAADGKAVVAEESKHDSEPEPELLLNQGSVGSTKWKGRVAQQMVDSIKQAEPKAERSLMHRFNLAKDFITTAVEAGDNAEGALAAVLIWLRFSSSRFLTWNKNYNIKPREISAAQDSLTTLLAQLIEQHSERQDLLRLGLAAVSRGGQGDVGQRIRDEILYVQSRNNAKGGMMEEWHQKLHNNTSPDDVAICQALIAYLQNNLDISHYWATLEAANITKERLASFDRPIRSEPSFKPEQQAGLLADLSNYLHTLKAVHSGEDLQSAAAAVMGYEQVTMKGKAIKVNPVPGVATAKLQSLLDKALDASEALPNEPSVEADAAAAAAAKALGDVKDLMAVRLELMPALARGNDGCANRFRDVLYLDMALETAVRSTVESALSQLHNQKAGLQLAAHTCLSLDLTEACAENARLSMRSDVELAMICKDLQVVQRLPDQAQHKWLRAHAACERLSRHLGTLSLLYIEALQPTADALGKALGLPTEATSIFAEEVIRGTAAAPLAQLLAVLTPALRQLAGLPSWHIISSGNGSANGQMQQVATLAPAQHQTFEQPTILLVQQIGGEEDIPQGVVGVVTQSVPDVLCHAAVRARNSAVLLAACTDKEDLASIAALSGQQVVMQIAQDYSRVLVLPTDDGDHDEHMLSATAGAADDSSLPQLASRKWCGQYVLPSDKFSNETVGAKSLSILRLKGCLPSWVNLPSSAALPFGAFEAVLQHEQNAAVAQLLHDLCKDVSPSEQLLLEARQAVQSLESPPEVQEQLRESLQTSGMQWDQQHPTWDNMWHCIKAVWASNWNTRAVLSLHKAGLQHADLQMAVLCQQVVPAKYAFVAHTTHPTTGRQDQVYLEVVQGFGETLVGNYPGQALQATVNKQALSGLLEDHSSLGADVQSISQQAVTVNSYPSKSIALRLLGSSTASTKNAEFFFRSDSNGEDLEGYAGAGLFDSLPTEHFNEVTADYSADRLINDTMYQNHILASIAAVCSDIERVAGSAQDIEGVVDWQDAIHIVQSRPQV